VVRIKSMMALVVMAGAVVLAPSGVAQAAVITPAAGVEIKAAHSNKCLNIKGGTTTDDTPVVQYNCSDSFTNDKFKVVPSGTGTYQIIATFDNKCLNVYKGTDTNNTPVHQYTCSTATNSLWKFVPVAGKATFRIVSADSGKCLNVYEGSQAINTAVNIYTCGTTTTLNDQFYFPPATSPDGVPATNPAGSPVAAVQGGGGTAAVGPLVYSFTSDTGTLFTGFQQDPGNFANILWQAATDSGNFVAIAGHPSENVQADGKVVTAAQGAGDGDLQLSIQSSAGAPPFGNWQDVGGSNPGGAAQPVTVKLPSGKLVTFSIIGGSLWHLPQDGTNLPYGGWRQIGGANLTGEVSTVVTQAGGLRIFALDTTGAVETALYTDGKLGEFTSLGGSGFTGRIGVNERTGFLSRLVMRGSDGSVVTKNETSPGVFEPNWTVIPGITAAGNPAISIDPATDRAVIAVRTPDGTHDTALETSEASGQFLPWVQTEGASLVTDPTLFTYTTGTGGSVLAYVGRDSNSKGWVFTLQNPTGLSARAKTKAGAAKTGATGAFVGHAIGTPTAG
jgi:hypothetical protein